MENKKDVKFVIIFLIISVISILYLSRASYAKYRKQANANVDTTVASWNIKVNNETINNKTTLTNSITPTYDSNQYIKSGVLAPGSTGYFDIVINALEVDVDFTYVIEGSVHEDTPLNDLIITQYEQGGNTYNYNSTDKITGEIQKNTGNTTIRVHFKWNEDNNQTMNNQQDTSYATNSNYQQTKIKATISFNQKQ
jgi:hypothetical protein